MAKTIRLVVEYDGTDFHGWQIQPNVRTVQGALEDAIERMTGVHARVKGASRTDAGVHAEGQVAHFDTESSIPTAQFSPGLTVHTGWDLAVVHSEEAPSTFSARFDSQGKIYRYCVWNRPRHSPLHRRTSWHVARPLDIDAMRAGARHLVGLHDFASFRASACDAPTTVRELRRVELRSTPEGLVELTIEGTAFLQHMVRIVMGTLVQVGWGQIEPDDVARVRDALDRDKAGPTAPPQGLCLVKVHY